MAKDLDTFKNAALKDNRMIGTGLGAVAGALIAIPIPIIGPLTGAVIGGILGNRAIKKTMR